MTGGTDKTHQQQTNLNWSKLPSAGPHFSTRARVQESSAIVPDDDDPEKRKEKKNIPGESKLYANKSGNIN